MNSPVSEDQRQCRERPVVGEILFRSVARGMEQNGAELQSGIVSDSETPVGRYVAPGVGKIAVYDGQQISDLLRAGPVWPQLAPVSLLL